MKVIDSFQKIFYEKFFQNKSLDDIFSIISIIDSENYSKFTYFCKLVEKEHKCFEQLSDYCFNHIQNNHSIKESLIWINILSTLNLSSIKKNINLLLSLYENYQSIIIQIISNIYSNIKENQNIKDLLKQNIELTFLEYPDEILNIYSHHSDFINSTIHFISLLEQKITNKNLVNFQIHLSFSLNLFHLLENLFLNLLLFGKELELKNLKLL